MKWEKKTLDQLGRVSRGKSKHRPRNDAKLFGGQYPFIQTADVKNANFYINEYSQTYSDFGLAQSKLWYEGTLCITIAANIADTAILGIKACFPDSIMGFIPYEGVSDVRFIKYMFDVLQKECQNISQGTAQDNLSWEKLSTIKFCVPDYETQQRIANILYAYDELIENNHKQIKLLEEAAQRLYKEWFVYLRFPGYENVKVIDGVPEGWCTGKIGEIGEFVRGKTITKDSAVGGNVPVVAGGLEPAYYHNKSNVKAPVITISGSGANAGFTNVYFEDIWASDCSYLSIEKCKNLYYVYIFLKTSDKLMQNLQKGSAQPHVYAKNVNALDILIPADTILVKFANRAELIFNKIANSRKAISELKEARDRLLPKLMNGELEV